VGRQYAAILGTIAFTVAITQALVRGVELGPALETAFLSTMAFWGIGYCVGNVAGWIVRDSIHEDEIETLLGQAHHTRWVRQTSD